ncbi:MAG: adenosylcobinamide-GDP ribazoletransferase [Pseudomonadota bacterium]
MNGLLFALQFLTRIPVWRNPEYSDKTQAESVPWFFAVGLVIGIALLVPALIAEAELFEPAVAALVLVVTWIVVTGGLHLDGLGDCADGWMSGKSGEQLLNVMKDLQAGTGAIIAVPMLILIKWICSWQLLIESQWVVFLVTPMIARAAVAVYLAKVSYFPDDGLGKSMHSGVHSRHVLVAIAVSALVVLVTSASLVLPVTLGTVCAVGIVHLTLTRRLGGASGDIYGALIETIEAFILLFVLIAVQ